MPTKPTQPPPAAAQDKPTLATEQGRLERSFAKNQEAIHSAETAKEAEKLLKDVPADAGFRRFRPD